MPRAAVYLVIALTPIALACSNVPDRVLAPSRALSVAAGGIPFATGVHTAAIPALDQTESIGTHYMPSALNDLGEIVGMRFSSDTLGAAFSWTPTFGLRLTQIGDTVLRVNNDGMVALSEPGNPGTDSLFPSENAAIWDWQGNVRRLRLVSTFFIPGIIGQGEDSPACAATGGITDGGVVVGVCHVVGHGSVPTIWTRFGTPWPISGHFIDGYTPHGISRTGFIAAGPDGNNSHAIVLTMTGIQRILPDPPGVTTGHAGTERTAALAVNDSGWAAGYRVVGDSASCQGGTNAQAVVWLAADTAIVIGDCSFSLTFPTAAATGISDDGIVVGITTDQANGAPFAFVWTATGGLRRLPGLEGGAAQTQDWSGAVAINHKRQVLGWVLTSFGRYRTVVWTLP
jgi:hypothetical protein